MLSVASQLDVSGPVGLLITVWWCNPWEPPCESTEVFGFRSECWAGPRFASQVGQFDKWGGNAKMGNVPSGARKGFCKG
jgi:hypothetical protein